MIIKDDTHNHWQLSVECFYHHVFLDPPVVVVVAGVAADLAVSLTAPVHLALTQP